MIITEIRAWDAKRQEMTYSKDNYPLTKYKIDFSWLHKNELTLSILTNPSTGEMEKCDAEFMQYTGIVDILNNKIFEGDILLSNTYKGVVKFGLYKNSHEQTENVGFYVECCTDDLVRKDLGYFCKKSTVIGNIHENSALLPR